MKKTIVTILLIIGAFSNASAQAGFGGADCGEWVRSPSDPKRHWLLGYMSGLSKMHFFNGKDDDPLDKINSAQQIFLWMDNYCKRNPLKNVRNGGDDLFLELMKK